MGEALPKLPAEKQLPDGDQHQQKYTAETPKYQEGKDALAKLQEEIEDEKAKMKTTGYVEYTKADQKRLQTARSKRLDWEKVEEGRKQQGGFTGSTADLQAQLRKDIKIEERRRAKPESWPVQVSGDEFDKMVVDEAGEWHKRGYVASDEEAVLLPIPDEVALPKAQRYLELERKMKELAAERKKMGRPLFLGRELALSLLTIMEQEKRTEKEMNELEAYFEKNGIKLAQLENIIHRSKIETAPTTEKPIKKPVETTIRPHEVYGGRTYPTTVGIGGTGIGGVVSAMEPSSGVLRHYAGPRPGEVETGPERTNEEAISDLDRDLAKKETSAEKLLEKLLRSEQKIHLDNEENVAIILADKTLLAALEIQKWNGNKNILAQVAAEISLEKSDELVALEQKKGWLKRLFKSHEEKLLAKQMRALDDLIKALSPGSKNGPTSPQTKHLFRTISKR